MDTSTHFKLSKYTYEFDVADLPDELRTHEIFQRADYEINWVVMYWSISAGEWNFYRERDRFKFQDTARVITLNHEHWMQYMFIETLPPEDVYNYLIGFKHD